MKWISRHRWTTASLAITVVHIGTIYWVMHTYYGNGVAVVEGSPLLLKLADFHLYSIIAGTVVGLIGVFREKPEYYAVIAMIFAFFSYVVFVG